MYSTFPCTLPCERAWKDRVRGEKITGLWWKGLDVVRGKKSAASSQDGQLFHSSVFFCDVDAGGRSESSEIKPRGEVLSEIELR